MLEEDARRFFAIPPDEVRACLDRLRGRMRPDDYRKIEGWAKFLQCVKERLAAEDATMDELYQLIQDGLRTIPGSSMEPGRPCAR